MIEEKIDRGFINIVNEIKNDIKNLPVPLANLPWTHNYSLIEKVKDIDKRKWYAKKMF